MNLLQILIQVGAPILAGVIKDKSPLAGKVIDAVGSALGVPPTEDAIAEKYAADPAGTAETIQRVESDEFWQMIGRADKIRADIFKQEHKEGFFAWGWRPGWMWFLAFLWFGQALSAVLGVSWLPIEALITVTVTFTGLYMGGHAAQEVAKTVAGRK